MDARYSNAVVRFGRLAGAAGLSTALSAAVVANPAGASVIGTITSNGYTFTNFDPTLNGPAVGSNVNGVSNAGQTVGATVDVNNLPVANFTGTPANTTPVNAGPGQTAFGINSNGDIVGGNGASAFFLPHNGTVQTLTSPAGAMNAFGINDNGFIVGQYSTAGGLTPGFILLNSASTQYITVNAPSGPDIVNAQGINNKGLTVGFYQGNDGQAHGFTANEASASNGVLVATAVADPSIPSVAGEPGATFMFSQILGVNDQGLAVGYYGDSTGSQHGFLYNTTDGIYSFLDDPSAQFDNGVEITQITGITNSDEIAGFYTDANGAAHSFVACPTGVVCAGVAALPEPGALWVVTVGLGALGLCYRRRRVC